MAGELHAEVEQTKPNFINQPTKMPVAKVTAGGIGGAVVVVAVWIAGQFGLEVPAEVASAMTALVGFGASYFQKNKEIL